jgi:5-methyltetrahydropteroyltriglutamate--homocysteine methyltransferase
VWRARELCHSIAIAITCSVKPLKWRSWALKEFCHTVEGAYDGIAERLFSGLKHQRLLLEYDSERAGDFTPLRFIPKDKIAVLGLVTTKSADLESKDELKRRVVAAARYVPLEQMALSPQCGFNSGGDRGLQLTEDEQWRKFERIMETAEEIWGNVSN